jgi:hypothetical protein
MSGIGKILNKGAQVLGGAPSTTGSSVGGSLKHTAEEALGGLGSKGLSAMAPRMGSLPGLAKSLAGGASGLIGGAMNMATDVAAKAINKTPLGGLLHTKVGQGLMQAADKVLDNPLAQAAMSMTPQGRMASVGVDVLSKAAAEPKHHHSD